MIANRKIYDNLQIKYDFSDMEIAKLNYTLEVLFFELSKLLFFVLFFGITHKLVDFIVCFIVLLPFRSFSGGLHFNHYISCFMLSIAYFSTLIFFLSGIPVTPALYAPILIIVNILLFVIGPVPSKKRPVMPVRQYRMFRAIASFFAGIYSILILIVDDMPFQNLIVWALVLHTLQIICARLVRKGDKIHEKA